MTSYYKNIWTSRNCSQNILLITPTFPGTANEDDGNSLCEMAKPPKHHLFTLCAGPQVGGDFTPRPPCCDKQLLQHWEGLTLLKHLLHYQLQYHCYGRDHNYHTVNDISRSVMSSSTYNAAAAASVALSNLQHKIKYRFSLLGNSVSVETFVYIIHI